MTDQVTSRELAWMMSGAARRIREHHSWLSQLDSAAGDGDHGATMLRTMTCLEKAFGCNTPADLRTSLHEAGWSVLGVDGGASSSLIGAFFLGMSEAPTASELCLNCAQLADAFEAGLRAVCRQTKAKPGDKTMMDALTPAVETFSSAARAGRGIEVALQEAACAAKAGAEATKDLTARYGRAKLLGEKTRGFQDPGATSIALIFEGFYQGIVEGKGEVGNA
jgi:phosphoenolpyruvate---glycerone phosphotransferase subunit DhaL